MGKESTLQISYSRAMLKRKYNQWNLERCGSWIKLRCGTGKRRRITSAPTDQFLSPPVVHSTKHSACFTEFLSTTGQLKEKTMEKYTSLILSILTVLECWNINYFFFLLILKSFLKSFLNYLVNFLKATTENAFERNTRKTKNKYIFLQCISVKTLTICCIYVALGFFLFVQRNRALYDA